MDTVTQRSCAHKNSSGEPCRARNVGEDGLCSFHRRRSAGLIKHGQYAKAVPGVPQRYAGVYQEFLASSKPTELLSEMAMLRTIYVEMRDLMESRREQGIDAMVEEVKERLDKTIRRDPGDEELIQSFLDLVVTTSRHVYMTNFGKMFATLDELREVSDHLMKVVKAAEIMKKIQEGIKLNVQIDTNLLVRVIQQAIFPVVPESDRRSRIIQNLAIIAPSAAALPPPTAAPVFPEQPATPVGEPSVLLNRTDLFVPDSAKQELMPEEVSEW